MAIVFPNNWSASDPAALLPAKEKRIIPSNEDSEFVVIAVQTET